MKLRYAERIAVVSGLLFLTVWFIARLDGIIASRVAVERFENEEVRRSNPGPSTPASPADASIDTGLWSLQRILAYQDSLSKIQDIPIAILRVPKIGLRAPVFDGVDDLTLNRGLGRIPGTARIGQPGNVGIAGHRDGFFRGLRQTRPGDIIQIDQFGRTDTYIVRQIRIVAPKDAYVLRPTPVPTLTLVTCYPFYFVGSAPKRYIITASRETDALEHVMQIKGSASIAK